MKLKRPGTAVVFAVLGVAFIALVAPRLIHVEKMRARHGTLERELMKLRQENIRLERELRMLRDDPVYLERVAREKFNKAKEGEIVYKVIRPGDSSSETRQ